MPAEHPARDAGLAISLLTAIPTPARWPEDGRTQSAAWFPIVGWLLGAVGWGLAHLAAASGATRGAPLVVAALIVSVWAILTRLLHWDGLADVADGYWGSHDVSRRLEIMSDSHTGAFGATAVCLTALLEVSALSSILSAPHQVPLLLIPVFARLAATAAAWFGRPARAGGLGRSVMGRPSLLSIAITFVAITAAAAVAAVAFQLKGILFAALGILLAFAIPHLLAKRFSGVTGDVMGASVLLTETLLFVAFALGD